MKYINDDNFSLKNTVVSLGNFDGVHLGHQRLVNLTKKYAEEKGLNSVLFTFFPHPRTVLTDHTMSLILTSDEKRMILENKGVDCFIEYPFTLEFSKLKPEEFFKEVIVDKLDCKILVVGEGYRFGSGRAGNIAFLAMLCEKYNVKLVIAKHLNDSDGKVSSSHIRQFILDNEFDKVEEFLSRPYFISGFVKTGKRIGHKIGFPTVNLIPQKEKILPSDGIFVTKTIYNGNTFNSITNIGFNPTVKGSSRTVETFIFDFQKEIYGSFIKIMFYAKIRNELKFENIEDLKLQISNDVEVAKKMFE